jgi:hypothetical protein
VANVGGNPVRGYNQTASNSFTYNSGWTGSNPQSGDLILVYALSFGDNRTSKSGSLILPVTGYVTDGYLVSLGPGFDTFHRSATGTSSDNFTLNGYGGASATAIFAVCLASKTFDKTGYNSGTSGGVPQISQSLTTAQNNEYIIRFWWARSRPANNINATFTSGLTVIGSRYNDIYATWEFQATAGASGTKTATYSPPTGIQDWMSQYGAY